MFNFFKKPKNETSAPEVTIKSREINSEDFVPSNGLLARKNRNGKIEQFSPTWIFIEDHINNRIELLRKMNDNPTIAHEKAQVLRGGIKELKLILALTQEKKNNNINPALSQAYSENITDYFNH